MPPPTMDPWPGTSSPPNRRPSNAYANNRPVSMDVENLPNYDEATKAPTHPPSKGIEDPPTYLSNTSLNRSYYLPTGRQRLPIYQQRYFQIACGVLFLIILVFVAVLILVLVLSR